MSTAGDASAKEVPQSKYELSMWQKQLLSFIIFALGNIGLNELNAVVLKKDPATGIQLPSIFYTMWHMLTSALASLLLLKTVSPPPPEIGMPSIQQYWHYRYQLPFIGLLTSLNNGLNNISLSLVSLFVNQSIKAVAPLPTMVFSYFLTSARYGIPVILSVLAVTAGSVLSNYYKLSQGGSGSSQVIGIIVLIISLLAASLKPVIAQIAMAGTPTHPKLPPTSILFYDTATAFWFMLLYWVISDERNEAVDYFRLKGWAGVGIIAAGAGLAFVFNLSTYYYLMYTSALTSTIGSNGIKIFLIFISAIQDHVSDPTSWTGIGLVVVSIAAYGYFSYQEKEAAKKAKAAAGKESLLEGDPQDSEGKGDTEKGATTPNEQTPLKPQTEQRV